MRDARVPRQFGVGLVRPLATEARQRESVQQRMKRQAERGANPGKLLGGFVRERMGVMFVVVNVFMHVAILGIAFGRVVVMKMKKAFGKKNIARKPPSTHVAVRSTECNCSAASGKKCSSAMPSIRPSHETGRQTGACAWASC